MTLDPGPRTLPRSAGPGARLTGRGARRWYGGAVFGLLYQSFEVASVWLAPTGRPGFRIMATAILLVLYAAYVVLPPLVWPEPLRVRILAVAGYWAFSCLEFPLIGPYTIWVWVLIVVLAAFSRLPRVVSILFVVGVVGAQVLVAASAGWSDSLAYAAYVTLSVGVAMIGFGQLIQRNAELREAQHAIARLAVSEERARLARDLHDSLGHSLTVVAVKSELARKLVARDPERAQAEIADIERLAREGLHDLRAAVAGYRDVDLDAELASARTALVAAGIAAHVPADGAVVHPELRTLFGWVVREGATNVIRHARAHEVWIELGPTRVLVRDDGRAAAGATPGAAGRLAPAAGNGLRGLGERAEAAGARLRSGARPGGGFELEVTA